MRLPLTLALAIACAGTARAEDLPWEQVEKISYGTHYRKLLTYGKQGWKVTALATWSNTLPNQGGGIFATYTEATYVLEHVDSKESGICILSATIPGGFDNSVSYEWLCMK